jgi:hypothetical protein
LSDREAGSTSDTEYGLADYLLEALPDKIADFARVDVGRSVQPTEGN